MRVHQIVYFVFAAAVAQQQYPDAAATDPVKLGWMVGSPPPPDKIIRFADGGVMEFPKTRWAFSNHRQFFPTKVIARNSSAWISALPRAEQTREIEAVTFRPIGAAEGVTSTWSSSLAANYTDGIVILHKGRIVYERYFGVLKPEGQHIAFSVTKSFVATLASALVHEGKLDANATMATYVPELKSSGFADATLRQVMDMTTGMKYSEVYTDPASPIWDFSRAAGLLPRPANYQGYPNSYAYLQSVGKEYPHGERFAYKTINTDALAWVMARVTGNSTAQLLQERFWSKLGMEQDAYIQVDSIGTEFAGGGMSASLRDLARFGEMMRLRGRFSGQQIIPAAVVDDIVRGGNREHFRPAGYQTLPGWSYRSMWWVSQNSHDVFMARGIHGQAIYVDPKAEMVIARFASHPIAGNVGIDPMSLPAYEAVANYLMKQPKSK